MKLSATYFTCFLVGLCLSAAAQKKEEGKDIIRTHASQALPSHVVYRYPAFTTGQVYFKNGTASAALLNYNLAVGEMQFLTPKGDTLSVANEQDISYIVIGDNYFQLNKDVFEIVGDYAYVKLGFKQVIRMIDNEKIGAFGLPSSSGSISSLSVVDNNSRAYRLSANENYVYAREKTYYLVLKANGQALPATKQNILRSFSRHRNKIENYIAANGIDFKSEADLKKLLEFCTAESDKKK